MLYIYIFKCHLCSVPVFLLLDFMPFTWINIIISITITPREWSDSNPALYTLYNRQIWLFILHWWVTAWQGVRKYVCTEMREYQGRIYTIEFIIYAHWTHGNLDLGFWSYKQFLQAPEVRVYKTTITRKKITQLI